MTPRDIRAAAITPEQIDMIVEKLLRGQTLNRACASASVGVRDFRWRRFGDREVAQRVYAARVHGYQAKAAWHRAQAERFEAKARAVQSA
jgi:hypothetical protein